LTKPPEPAFEGSVACPYCGGKAEPEQDSDVIFFACTACGGEFGYRRAVQSAPVCAAGLPIADGPAQPPQPVFLGTTIKRRPE
jgi:hypothetical protein